MRQNSLEGWRYTHFSEKALNLSRYPGDWAAEIYINDKLAHTEKFKVIERPELLEEYKIFQNKFKYFKAGMIIADPDVSSALHKLKFKWDKDYGTVVEGLFENYPAERGGLKKGDIIIKINGNQVTVYIPHNPDKQSTEKRPPIPRESGYRNHEKRPNNAEI